MRSNLYFGILYRSRFLRYESIEGGGNMNESALLKLLCPSIALLYALRSLYPKSSYIYLPRYLLKSLPYPGSFCQCYISPHFSLTWFGMMLNSSSLLIPHEYVSRHKDNPVVIPFLASDHHRCMPRFHFGKV